MGIKDELREKFEKWMRQECPLFPLKWNDRLGEYVSAGTQHRWKGWQAAMRQAVPDTHVLIPREPTEDQWGGLARDIIMWHDMYEGNRRTPAALFLHLKMSGKDIPKWLRDESEMKNLDHVPSKGTRAVIIYKAMIEAGQVKEQSK